jgi:hypothetical protein
VAAAVVGVLLLGVVLAAASAPAWSWLALAAPAAAVVVERRRAGARSVDAYAGLVGVPGVADYAAAVADALHEAGLCPQSAADVRHRVDPDGVVGVDLPGPAAAHFAVALDELLGAPVLPRYVVGRPVLPALPPDDPAARRRIARAAFGRRLDPPQVCHAVPALFGVNAGRAKAFAHGWQRWIAATDPLYTGSPEGAGLLASAGGDPPVPVETVVRTRWE